MAIDKYKTCKDCPDRTISPNCHSTCEGYLHRVEKQKQIRKKKRELADFNGYIHDTVDVVKRVCKLNKSNKKKYK